MTYYIKLLGLSAVLLCFSCASSVSLLKTDYNTQIYICENMNYFISNNIPFNKRQTISKAFQYWNAVLDRDLFDNSLRYESHIFVLADKQLKKEEKWGRTNGNTKFDGCFTSGFVTLNPELFDLSDAELETVIRHEIGHVLSLGESLGGVQVMLPDLPVHPLSATKDQVEYIKSNVLRNTSK